MLQRAFALLLTLYMVPLCQAQSALSDADRNGLESELRFRMLARSEFLPRDVADFCVDIYGRLAMPGDRWNATDVSSAGGALPTRRLIWAAQSSAYFVVHYEQGGFAHTYHVVVATVQADLLKYKLVWRAAGPRLRDYPMFLRALRASDFASEPLSYR